MYGNIFPVDNEQLKLELIIFDYKYIPWKRSASCTVCLERLAEIPAFHGTLGDWILGNDRPFAQHIWQFSPQNLAYQTLTAKFSHFQ